MDDAKDLIERNGKDPQVYQKLEDILVNSSGSYSLPERFRALFSLKNLNTEQAVSVISKAFEDDSALLKHELAYCLGQMGQDLALPTLENVLRDKQQDPMVRHEAAEAMGAIGNESSIPVLEDFKSDEEEVVAETCMLALDRFKRGDYRRNVADDRYCSVDPTPAFDDQELSIPALREILLDEKCPLYERYRAMFSLRNLGTTESVCALADGLRQGKSALFRHEVAFVFGQMQHPASVDVLKEVLANNGEIDMVRHECAEALGSIATGECLPELSKYLNETNGNEADNVPVVVRQSCEVALDMYAYENDNSSFHYASIPGK